MIDLKIGSLYILQDSKANTIRPAFFGHVVKLLAKGAVGYEGYTYCKVQLVTIPESAYQALKGNEVSITSASLGEYKAVSNEEGIKLLNQEEF